MVYDVTDPIDGPHVPLTRPHAVLDPFQPPDRDPVRLARRVRRVRPERLAAHPEASFREPADGNSLATAPRRGCSATRTRTSIATPASVRNDGLAAEQGPFADNGAYYRNNAGAFRRSRSARPPPRSLRVRDADERERDCHRRGRLGRALSPSRSSSSAGGSTCALVEGYETQQTCPATASEQLGRRRNSSPTGSSMGPSARSRPPSRSPSSRPTPTRTTRRSLPDGTTPTRRHRSSGSSRCRRRTARGRGLPSTTPT